MFPVPPEPDQPDLSSPGVDERFTAVDITLRAPKPEEEDLVTVATYPLANEAELAKLHLAEAGIEAILADAETVNMDWILGNALGFIKVQVLRSNADKAEAILRSHQSDKLAVEDDADTEVMVCLACGKPITESESSCPSCGWSYEGREDA